MEKIVQYFIEELQHAGNTLAKLSIVTALHESFLTKVSSSEVPSTNSNLLQCLFDILKDEYSLHEHPRIEGNSSSSRNEKDKTLAGHGLGDSFSKKISISQSGEAVQVQGLLKLMTLKCICEFSYKRENLFKLDAKMKKSMLSFLANICNVERNRYSPDSDSFRYSHNFTKCLKKYVNLMDYKVKVKVVPDANDTLCDVAKLKRYLEFYGETDMAEYIRQISESSPFELLGLSVFAQSSTREDSGNDHVDLLDMLVSQQVAWGRRHKFRSGNSEEDKDSPGVKKTKAARNDFKVKDGGFKTDICDSLVRHILNGNLLWVNVGKDSIENVEQVHLTLKQKFESNSLGRCRYCTQNAIVAVLLEHTEMQWCCGVAQQEKMIIRGKVLSVIAGVVTIFGIDVGGVYRVPLSSIFLLPSDLGISAIPQQVTLAYLYDVSPTPVECSYVEMPVAIMHNFCRSIEGTRDFVDLNCLGLLPALITCGDFTIAFQALRLSCVISKNSEVGCSEDWCQILFSVLECLNKLVQKIITATEIKRQRVKLPQTSPLTKDGSTTRCSFEAVDDNDSGNVSKKSQSDLEKDVQRSSPMKSPYSKGAISKMQKSPDIVNSSSPTKEKRENESSQNVPTTKKIVKDKMDVIIACLRLLANLLHKNQPMKEVFYHQSGLESVLICQRVLGNKRFVASSVLRLLFNFVNTHSAVGTGLPGHIHNKNQAAILEDVADSDDGSDDYEDVGLDVDGFDEDDDWNESGGSGLYPYTSSPCPDEGEKDSNVLIKGSVYPHVTNPRYEMLEGLDWTSLSLAAIVSGMLNSGQVGTICVGVGKGGEVRGETVSHDMRDELRLGMDDLMAHLVPNVMHFQLQVQFVPVVESADLFENPRLHVIEIMCNPIRGVIHSLKNGKVYYRTGSKTILVNEQDIRHLIVIDEEQKFMDEIVDLQRKLKMLSPTSEGDNSC